MYLSVLAVACLPLGLLWDISWHVSIGRDTFWAPAHIVIQLGGIIPALLFAWQAANITFRGTAGERAASVRFWGARAPFGAWVTMWGALAMLTSAPFDDWWHNTYGLDVKIASPPHALLGLGMFAVALGVLLSVLSWQNRSCRSEQRAAPWLFTLACGLIVTMLSAYATEFTWPNRQHTSNFYQVISCLYPLLFVAIARASKLRWAATITAVTYMGIMVALIWMLPLFSAQPKLAPIYNPVDHMVPPPFPMLMAVPALAIDLLLRGSRRKEIRNLSRANTETSILVVDSAPSFAVSFGHLCRRRLKDWFLAFVVGLTFLMLALAVQWFFAKFLLSPAADNWFFAGNRHWPYYVQPGEWTHKFWSVNDDPVTRKGLAIAAGLAVFSARLGVACGNWMLKVKR
jgi:multisubunit Na+/H+ antiporter MnhB subunit